MAGTIIVIVLVFILMLVTIYLIIKSTLGNVNERGKAYFTRKLSELDEQRKHSDEEKEEKEEKEKTEVLVKNDTNVNDGSVILYQSKDVNNIDVKEVLQFVKRIDSKFNYDERYIVEEFYSQTINDDSTEKYNKLIDVKKYIEKIGVYELLRYDSVAINKFKNEISKIDDNVINTYEKLNGFFDLENFIQYLEIEINKSDPIIYVLVSNKNISFNDVGEKIKTIYKEEVYRGIKIIYKGNIYDYSLG